MPKAVLDAPAPDFAHLDYQGNLVTLSHFKDEKNLLLVFNRGFT